MPVADSDLTTVSRIRNAALEGFTRDGIAATSIRDVAKAADVSPGLVQHHFKTKADLEQAVNEYVLQIGVEASQQLEADTTGASTGELFQAIGETIARLVHDHRVALLYVIRSAAYGEQTGLDIFDTFLALVNTHVERIAADGALRDDADRLWIGLQVVILNLGTVLLEPAINRHLPEPLLQPDQLERWRKASSDLLAKGFVNRDGC